ncbi:MAG: helix-turn-helix domain-containing protein [Lachnospiraceae bacterium]|nr:helix-turn-helix domain-containing protein [Lachnospiraceae bacterium]
MYDKIECGNRLKHLREVKGKTQHEVAAETGISVNTIRKLEQGKRTITLTLVDRLRDYYKTTADYIVSGTQK